MPTNTPLLGLLELAPAQDLPETRVNHTNRWLEAAGGGRMVVADSTLGTPPGSPAEGDAYLVPAAGTTGAWVGKEGKLALLINGAWSYATARDGFAIEVLDEDSAYVLRGGTWVVTSGAGAAANEVVTILVTDPNGTAITTGDGKAYYPVPSTLNGFELVGILAYVITTSSSGLVSVQVHNLTQAVDMLSTNVTIDASETSSALATTPASINAANDDVLTGDMLRIDVDGSGTGAKGLIIEMQFAQP